MQPFTGLARPGATHMKLHHLLQKCSFFLIKLAVFLASGGARMKLPQNGTVSFPIRLAAFQASGAAYMKLHKIRCRSKKYLTAEIAEYAEII